MDESTGSPVVRMAGGAEVTTRALAEVLRAETAKRPRLLLVDISALTFHRSAASQVVLRAHKEPRAGGGALAPLGPAGGVARVLQLTGTGQVAEVFASAGEAVSAAR